METGNLMLEPLVANKLCLCPKQLDSYLKQDGPFDRSLSLSSVSLIVRPASGATERITYY